MSAMFDIINGWPDGERYYRDARGLIHVTVDDGQQWTTYSRNGIVRIGPWDERHVTRPVEVVPADCAIPADWQPKP